MNRVREIALLGAMVCPVVAAEGQQTREFGAAVFAAPAGFNLESKPTVLNYGRVRDRELCLIAVYGDEVSPPGLDAALRSAWTGVFRSAGYRKADLPSMREQTSPAGYRHGFGEGDLEDRGGNRFVARLHLFPVGARTQTVIWMGNSRAALDGCRPEWEAFFSSLRFPSVAAANPPAANPPVPADTAPGAPQTFENITFTPPGGWRVQRTDQGVTLTPTAVRPGEALQVLLLPGRAFNGTLTSQFAAAWNETMALFRAQSMRTVNGGLYDLKEPGRSLRGWEYLQGNGGMITDGGRGRWGVDLYLIRAGDRLERVVVISREFRLNLMTLWANQNPVHERAVRRLIFTLDFANQPSLAVGSPKITGATSGVWGGSSMSFGQYKATFAVLFWGTYTMTDERGEIRMPYGKIPMRRVGPALEVTPNGTPHKFARLSMPASNQLEGTWCLRDDKCLEFGPSGRFRDNGVVRIVEHATYDYPEAPEGGDGTYLIKDYSLILRYSTGQEYRVAFLGLVGGSSSSPGQMWLSFNLDALTKR